MRSTIRLLLLFCCAIAALHAGPAEARRVALAIGNSQHKFLPALKNPGNDAAAVADALTKLGFDAVILRKDLGLEDFHAALRELARESKDAEAAVVFFAGNGLEANGRNYLIPVDARLERADTLEDETVSLDTVVARLAGAKLGLVVLDACRDNPFLGRWAEGARGMHRAVGDDRGLPKLDVDRRHNLFVVFSSEAGTVAEDGRGDNSPFTEALVKHLPTSGLELRHLVVRVRADVISATAGRQVPAYWDRFNGEFWFAPAQ